MRKLICLRYTLAAFLLLCAALLFSSCGSACTEHTFGEGRVIRAATCTEEGELRYVCSVCQTVRSEPIPCVPHVTMQQTDATEHRSVCTVCETVTERASHTDEVPTVTEAAAVCKSAVHTFACTACPYTWQVTQPPEAYHTLVSTLSDGELVYTCATCDGAMTLTGAGVRYDYESKETTVKNWNSASETAWRSYVSTQDGNTLAVCQVAEIKTTTNGTAYHFSGPFTGLREVEVFVIDFDVCALRDHPLVMTTLNPKDTGNAWPGAILSIYENGAIANVHGIEIAAPGTVTDRAMTHVTIVYDTTLGSLTYYINGIGAGTEISEAHIGRRINYFNLIIQAGTETKDVGRSICLDNMLCARGATGSLSTPEEAAAMTEFVKAEAERLLRELQASRIESIKEAIASFDTVRDFGADTATPLPTNVWDAPLASPTEGQHPRLFFTKEDIPSILAVLERDPVFASRIKRIADGGIDYGVLPTPTIRSNGVYNYSAGTLEAIQLKALYYQLTGNEYYGYEAILSIKNYIKTLGIGYFNSDQCRYFGQTVYTAACVYDWCYDLLTEEDKLQLRIGVVKRLLEGNSGCYYLDKQGELRYCDGKTVEGGPVAQKNIAKMEIGFPPSHAGALFGHNSEYQLLRDYMSFAAAIYDEDPTWWQYCGGRFYQQYYPARQYFYNEEARIYPEGTACYGTWRFVCDMYAAWMLHSMTGELIYEDSLRQVPYSFLAHEAHDKAMFGTGDGGAQTLSGSIGSGALMIAYFYSDPVLYENAAYVGVGLNLPERLILYKNNTTPCEDRTEGFAAVQYNGGHYGQLIVRRSWEDETTPVVLMKGAGLINGGHDHNDFGSFQIYYKGMLTTEDGIYDVWGSTHHFYYHVATVAHNSMLIYNPSIEPHSHYNGGQRHLMSHKPNGRQNLEEWMHKDYVMGKTTGLATGYGEEGDVRFVYYALDLTSAYYERAVDDYRRSMLVVYTGREDVPMLMLVMDCVDGYAKDTRTRFLLQCVTEPRIDEAEKTVTVKNGGGQLVLKSLLGTEEIYAYGRTSKDGKVDPAAATGDERFYLSGLGYALPSGTNGKGDNTKAWGHVELCAKGGSEAETLLQLLYVTDADATPAVDVRTLTGEGYVGASVFDTVAVFATDAEPYAEELTFTSLGLERKQYYVGGLAEGSWRVTVSGKELGTFDVRGEEAMLHFEARSGKVTLTPVK